MLLIVVTATGRCSALQIPLSERYLTLTTADGLKL